MKVLFATHDGADFLSSCLWDGLQEVLGVDNVYDAGNNLDFHRPYSSGGSLAQPSHRICGSRQGPRARQINETYDLLVLNACFLHQHDWHWAWSLRERLSSGGKVAFVEGGDSAYDVNNPWEKSNPPFQVDAVFRREIDMAFSYPYRCFHLDFAAPSRWVKDTLKSKSPRTIDVFFAGGPGSHPVRWEMMRHLFHVDRHYTFVYAQQSTTYHFTPDECMNLMRRSKFGLCPPGGGSCASTMRLYETLASGAIPVSVCQPPRYREPEIVMKYCYEAKDLSSNLEHFLATTGEDFRAAMLEDVMKNHTTAARARKLLEIVGA